MVSYRQSYDFEAMTTGVSDHMFVQSVKWYHTV